jgi:hypothetical protein
MGISVFDEQFADVNLLVFDSSNSPGTISFWTGDKTPRRVDAVLATNNDSIDHTIELRVNNGGSSTRIGSAVIPAGQGYAGTPGLNLLELVLPANVAGIVLDRFWTLDANCLVALTGSNGVFLTSLGGTF